MSKFMFFDFRCNPCDHIFEAFVKPDDTANCPKCDQITANRLVSGGRAVIDINSEAWVRMNKQKTKQDKKFFDNHGVDKKHHSYGS
jgi:putative FmdB family regulatory protein